MTENTRENMTENAREDEEEDDFLIFGGLENIVSGDENWNGDDDSDGFRSGNANFETAVFETAVFEAISREDVIEQLKKRVRCRLSKENMQAFES